MKNLLLIVAVAVSAISMPVLAAPFCSVHSFGKQCYYYSMRSCLQFNDACVVNREEVKPPSGGAPFCVVQSFGTNCWYYNASSCQEAARNSGGACVYNDN